jgi:hypothetical protein
MKCLKSKGKFLSVQPMKVYVRVNIQRHPGKTLSLNGVGARISVGARNVSLLREVQTGFGAHLAYLVGTGVLSWG